jgi:uncharacterized protein (UPF0548 family)
MRLRKPTEATIRDWLRAREALPFSYPDVGRTRDLGRVDPPPGYVLDHNRVRLGSGPLVFERSKDAIRRWEMFRIGWVELCWPSAPIVPGTTVAVLARALCLWTLNACRVVYAVEEAGEVERFGFAYGTLLDHAESGEERFMVEWRREDDSVWYDLLAFSRPRRLSARLGRFYARRLQRRFARDSLRAMERAAG